MSAAQFTGSLTATRRDLSVAARTIGCYGQLDTDHGRQLRASLSGSRQE
ncbi:hypothetical protein C4K14_3514 [Pseudomonas chlororaphis subsp. aureofaciens]|nr:hypothetical protein C4K14_3514 [Pseudomonas chlororaphis subsp. aureofaciens]